MCLSSVYELSEGGKTLLCKNVTRVKLSDEGVELFDLMGARRVVAGTVSSIDLVENEILLEPPAPRK